MPTPRNIFLLALIAITAVSAAHAVKPSAKPQEVFAPYWTSDPGWETDLQLKNNLSSGSLTVTPVLRLASGEEIALDPMTITSNASASVQVNEGLLKHSPTLVNQPGSYGSVVFRFTSFHPRNLTASAEVSLHGSPIGRLQVVAAAGVIAGGNSNHVVRRSAAGQGNESPVRVVGNAESLLHCADLKLLRDEWSHVEWWQLHLAFAGVAAPG